MMRRKPTAADLASAPLGFGAPGPRRAGVRPALHPRAEARWSPCRPRVLARKQHGARRRCPQTACWPLRCRVRSDSLRRTPDARRIPKPTPQATRRKAGKKQGRQQHNA